MISVLISSPMPALRAGLSALLSGDPELEVAGAAANIDELVNLPAEDCVVIATLGGVDLPGADLPAGLALLLVAADPQEFGPDLWQALEALELRAWGIIAPDATAEALQAAVRALAEGLVVFSPVAARQMALGAAAAAQAAESRASDAGEDDPPHERLTEREVDVLRQIALGLTNKQIALALKISEHTVKFHVSSIYGKLNAANRTEAVRKGARKGWIPL